MRLQKLHQAQALLLELELPLQAASDNIVLCLLKSQFFFSIKPNENIAHWPLNTLKSDEVI